MFAVKFVCAFSGNLYRLNESIINKSNKSIKSIDRPKIIINKIAESFRVHQLRVPFVGIMGSIPMYNPLLESRYVINTYTFRHIVINPKIRKWSSQKKKRTVLLITTRTTLYYRISHGNYIDRPLHTTSDYYYYGSYYTVCFVKMITWNLSLLSEF